MIAVSDKRLLGSGVNSECEFLKPIIETAEPQTLRILDFGGGGGSHGFAFLSQVRSWAVVETPVMVEAAKEVFSSDSLFFHSSIESAYERLGKVDIVHVSSSLQYTPEPMKLLIDLLSLSPELLVFEKLVTTSKSRTSRFSQYSFLRDNVAFRSAKQISSRKSTRYLLTAMSRPDVMRAVLANYKIDRLWEYPTQSHLPFGKGLEQWGFIGSKRR
jgi:putative methyltransferase (TIGR04325 family)